MGLAQGSDVGPLAVRFAIWTNETASAKLALPSVKLLNPAGSRHAANQALNGRSSYFWVPLFTLLFVQVLELFEGLSNMSLYRRMALLRLRQAHEVELADINLAAVGCWSLGGCRTDGRDPVETVVAVSLGW
jgi:hypothetical protein